MRGELDPGGALLATNNHADTLCDLKTGEVGMVIELEGGGGFVGRMAALGFTPGTVVQVVRNPGRGPIIVELLDSQIALGRGQAARVRVRRQCAPATRATSAAGDGA